MAWWGTLLGGTLGFMFGGPLGAMLGASVGSNFDKRPKHSAAFAPGDQQRVQAAFFTACFSVMGHIAKADGHVTADEISTARNIMAQMQLSEEQKKAAIKLFDEGKRDDFPLQQIVEQFRQECQRRRNLVQMFIEIQLATAMADGVLHSAEHQAIETIASILGFSHNELEHLIHLATGAAQQQHGGFSLDEAYAILNVSKNSSNADVKKSYRRLMSQHHPDKLVSKGLPEEMIKLATEKTQEIRKAYDMIKQSR